MAFNQKYLENHASSGAGRRIWTYDASADAADDTIAEVAAADYFLAARLLLQVGDLIYAHTSTGSLFLEVLSVSATTVTVGAMGSGLAGSATWDPGSIADGDEVAQEVTVTGAALGDFAVASFSLDVLDLVINAAVTAANTVTVILANNTGGAIDLAGGTVRAKVFK